MEKDNKKRNLIVVVLSLIIVLLVGVLVYLLFIKKDDKQDNQINQRIILAGRGGSERLQAIWSEGETSPTRFQLAR